MAVTPKMKERIDSEMAALKESDLRKPSTSIPVLIDTTSTLFAQSNKDKVALTAAGLPEDRQEYYPALHEIFSITFGVRQGIATVTPEPRVNFDQEYVTAQTDRRRLLIVADHIADLCNDAAIKKNVRELKKGNSIIDSLTDVLGAAPIVEKYPHYAKTIRPGGVVVDSDYCATATKRAVALLQQKGFVVEKGVPKSTQVDSLKRIITLCINAQDEIKKYAEAAFFEDMEYYNKYYVFSSPSNTPPTDTPETDTSATVTAAAK